MSDVVNAIDEAYRDYRGLVGVHDGPNDIPFGDFRMAVLCFLHADNTMDVMAKAVEAHRTLGSRGLACGVINTFIDEAAQAANGPTPAPSGLVSDGEKQGG